MADFLDFPGSGNFAPFVLKWLPGVNGGVVNEADYWSCRLTYGPW